MKHRFSMRSTFIFLGLLLVLATWYGFFRIVDEPPHPIHAWRNTDCLSITLNYHDNGMVFSEPAIHNYISDDYTSGKTAGEFPGWYYAMAALWKTFGVSEALYRSMVALLFVLSLIAVQRALLRIMNEFWSVALTLWLFVQPALVYYAFGFLSNVPALSFALFGGAAYVFFALNGRMRWLWIATACFALGALLKITALLLFCTLIGLILLEWMGLKLWPKRKLFPQPLKQLAILSTALLPIFTWYMWAADYNASHGGKYTFNGIWPLWEADAALQAAIWDGIRQFTARQIMAPVNWLIALGGLVAVVVQVRRIPLLLVALPLIFFAGSLVYAILWFQAWKDHDYYFIDLYVWPLLVLVVLVAAARYREVNTRLERSLRAVFVVLLAWSALYTQEHLALRYTANYDNTYITATDYEEGHLKYVHWDMLRNEYGLLGISPVLEAHGITKDTPVISIPDASFCITLYFMDRRGYTNMGDFNRTPESVRENIARGAKYLIVNESEYEVDFPWVSEFMHTPVLTHNNIRVFDLR